MEILFLAVFICLGIFLFIMAQKPMSRIFPDKYSELKQKHSNPLYSYDWLSGSFKLGPLVLRSQFLLKIDVYEKMIIVSSLGQGVCLPYDKYIFEQKKFLFYRALVVNSLPEFTLEISLSQDKINTILNLAQKSDRMP